MGAVSSHTTHHLVLSGCYYIYFEQEALVLTCGWGSFCGHPSLLTQSLSPIYIFLPLSSPIFPSFSFYFILCYSCVNTLGLFEILEFHIYMHNMVDSII